MIIGLNQLIRQVPKTWTLIATADVAQANFHTDLTTDNAFVELIGVDLTAYQTGKYLLGIYNKTGGFGLLGHISSVAPGTVESLDTDLIAGWDFTSGWTPGGTGSIVDADSFSSTGFGGVYKSTVMTLNCLYKVISAGSTTAVSSVETTTASGIPSFKSGAFGTGYGTIVGSGGGLAIYIRNLSAGTADITTLTVQRVTDPPSTGARIVSTKGGAVRSWYYKHASFDLNDAAGQTYKIWKIARPTIAIP